MKNISLILICSLLLDMGVYAQQKITGVVMDGSNAEPLVGASIVGTANNEGTITGSNGDFTLLLNHPEDSLKISSVGFKTQKIAITPGKLQISLSPYSASLNELVVTAGKGVQKRTEVPVSITAISSKMLEETKPISLDQVLNKVSGVYMANLGNEQHMMAIRQPITTKSNFLYLEDGIPIRPIGDFNHNALLEINQASIRRIEVIKGPSSSLYGSDAIGGAINYITQRPSLVPDVKAELEGSNRGYKRVNFSGSHTFNKTGILISGYYANQRHGPRDNTDFNKYAITARIDQQLSSRSRLYAVATRVDYKTDAAGGLDSAAFFGKKYKNSFYTFNDRTTQAWRTRLTFEHEGLKGENLKATVYYRDNQVGQNPSYRIKSTSDPLKASGEINNDFFKSYGFQGEYSNRLNWWNTRIMVGLQGEYSPDGLTANYITVDRDSKGVYTGFEMTDSVLTDYRVNVKNLAGYTQIQTNPISDLRIVLGLRYDLLYYDYINHLPPTAFSGAPDGTNTFNQFSPKLGLTYDFGNDRGLYLNYSLGFGPPDVSDLYRGVKIPVLKPAQYDNYEAGGWLSFDHKNGYADVSFYRMKGKNEIVNVRLADGSSENRNAGRTSHTGIEYTVSYRFLKTLEFRVSGTNAKHEYEHYQDGGKIFDGNRMDAAPSWIANTTLSYHPGFVKNLLVSMEWQKVSSYFMDEANTLEYPGYDTFNFRVNYGYKKFEVWAQVINLFNKNYATKAQKTAFSTTYTPGDLRTLYVGIGYHLFQGKKEY